MDEIIVALATRFYSHLHMINRQEAREILGEQVEWADVKLSTALDGLLRCYEEDFRLRKPFVLGGFMLTPKRLDFGSADRTRADGIIR